MPTDYDTINAAWVTAFGGDGGYTILSSPEGAPSTRMSEIYSMVFDAADDGKSLLEVFTNGTITDPDDVASGGVYTGPSDFGLQRYKFFIIDAPQPYPNATPDHLEVGNTLSETGLDYWGFKRKIKLGESVPHSQIYCDFTDYPGVQHACVSVDMYVPSTFDFQDSHGKLGIGIVAGDSYNDGGSTPIASQAGAASRPVRDDGDDSRMYTYSLNRALASGHQDTDANMPIPRDQWFTMECEVFINDLGSDNGFVRYYLNGTKFCDYTGLRFRTTSQPFLLNKVLINDMWQVFNPTRIRYAQSTAHYWYANYKVLVPGTPTVDDWAWDLINLNYDFTTTNTTRDITVTVTNQSGGALTPTFSVSGDSEFAITAGATPGEIADGATTDVTVRFSPTTDGQFTGTLTGTSGDGVSIPMFGTSATLQSGLEWAADLGTIISPMVATDPDDDSVSTGTQYDGYAVYAFTIPYQSSWKIIAEIKAESVASNSAFVQIDNWPDGDLAIWDIVELTTGFEDRDISHRGLEEEGGAFDNQLYDPMRWELSAGTHYLVIQGRETATYIKNLSVVELAIPPRSASKRMMTLL